jgi:AcrR family transcriptional regulator
VSASQQAKRDRAGADAPARPRGRPRSAEAHGAILSAAIALLAEHGLRGLSIEAVAAEAGVGKTTIYRRWSSKEELIVEAVEHIRPPAGELPDTGSFVGDLMALAALQEERLAATAAPRLVPILLSESTDNPELHALLVERLVRPLRAILTEFVRRGVERGELRSDLDVEPLVDVIHGTPVYRLLLTGGDLTGIRDRMARVVRLLMEGVSSSSAGPASARRRS